MSDLIKSLKLKGKILIWRCTDQKNKIRKLGAEEFVNEYNDLILIDLIKSFGINNDIPSYIHKLLRNKKIINNDKYNYIKKLYNYNV